LTGCYAAVDPRDGRVVLAGKVDPGLGLRENVIDLPEGPSVLIFTEEPLSGRFG
jgi:hypothetical protein